MSTDQQQDKDVFFFFLFPFGGRVLCKCVCKQFSKEENHVSHKQRNITTKPPMHSESTARTGGRAAIENK